MTTHVEVIVLGGGPAGCAAAIWCALQGRRVVLVERDRRPRDRPGETLHPGTESPLRQLGVADAVADAGVLRHAGHWVAWDGPLRFVGFGGDHRGRWHGFQVTRSLLDELLQQRARAVGVEVRRQVRGRGPLIDHGRVVGVDTTSDAIRARFTVDATGRGRWLARRLGLRFRRHSPRLTAVFGYAADPAPGGFDACADAPVWTAEPAGWVWTARVQPEVHQWTRLRLAPGPPCMDAPAALASHAALGRPRGADVTWGLMDTTAGPGYVLVGDAAAVLDPASSHGVLRALLSGMFAAHVVTAALDRPGLGRQAAVEYDRWLRAGFAHDVTRLRSLYRQLPEPPAWVGRAAQEGTSRGLTRERSDRWAKY